jgi:uncharacterized protein YyaL (SSP411 family)
VLGNEADPVLAYYGVTEAGNFEGANILEVVGDTPPADLEALRSRLLDARAERIRPGLDDKVVASWNGLAIRALAEAGAVLGEESYLDLARDAAGFVLDNLVVDGVLMRSWREGRTSVPGFLDDHASMALGRFVLYAATGEERWYTEAMNLVESFARFRRPDGGFYSTADDAATMVKRPTDLTDNPAPSGNALAAEALLWASLYTGDGALREESEAALRSAAVLAERYPSMVGHHLAVTHSSLDAREVAIVGEGWNRLAEVYWSRYRPGVVLAAAPSESRIPLLEGRFGQGTKAYVCRGFVCDLPTSDPEVLAAQLG